MLKYRLMTPGPTTIPEKVLAKFAEPIIHHRTSLFEAEFKQLRDHLQWLFQTKNDVLTLTATGTGAMEATITNLFSAQDQVIVVDAGKFGERWTKISKAYGLTIHEIKVPRGEALNLSVLESMIKSNPNAKAVLFQASETSTGAMQPVQKIAEVCKKANLLCVCDGITAVGIFDVPMDTWGIDVLITGSQKALMLPPGLAFIAFSDRAWKQADQSTLPRFYFNLKKEREAQAKMQTAWTPAISLVQGAVVSLGILRAEGLQKIFARHEQLAQATRAAVLALGLELFSKAPSPVLTTVCVPKTISDGKMIPKMMQEKYGVIITGGQDELAGKIFRLSHFGYTDSFDVISGIVALEYTLKQLGHPFPLGSGVQAAMKCFE
jgi:aspartate aminotransferase-like enzyme